jgi:hypothetical protein
MDDITVDHCKYYGVDLFNERFVANVPDNILVMHQNIRSFNKNADEFFMFMSQLDVDIDVLVLTESWFSNQYTEGLAGYSAYHIHREERRGGGVSIFVRESLCAKVKLIKTYMSDFIELCVVDLHFPSGIFVNVMGVYRSQRMGTIDQSIDMMSQLFHECNRGQYSIIAGDLNIDLINPSNAEIEFINFLKSFSYLPLITKATHVTDVGGTCLDHVWTNSVVCIDSGIIPHSITDHYTVFASCPVAFTKKKH